MAEENVPFEEFRQMVGASHINVREAIKELDIKPIRPLHDMRQTLYPVNRVKDVQKWIVENRSN